MSDPWTVVYSDDDFKRPLHSYLDEITARLKKDAPRAELEKRLAEYEEFKNFKDQILNLITTSGELTSELRSASDGYHVINVGSWSGYYKLDYSQRICWGILVVQENANTNMNLTDVLVSAAKRLSEAQEKKKPT